MDQAAHRTQAGRAGRTPSRSGMRVRLGLFVEDMETSIGFYTRVLGFEVGRGVFSEVHLTRGGCSVVVSLRNHSA